MPAHRRPASARHRGFTITELMISLALVLLLVIAMTQIFRVTSTTIAKGNATGEVVRGLDAARTALQLDFTGNDEVGYNASRNTSGILPADEQPSIIIYSTSTRSFLNQADLEADEDGDPTGVGTFPTIDSNNDGIDDMAVGRHQTGRRWFRTDVLSFFTRGDFKSQANLQGAAGAFTSDITSHEAWVWYGHGRVYDGQGPLNTAEYANGDPIYVTPGAGNSQSNPNHYFADQFVLLRNAILLKQQEDHDGLPGTAVTATDDRGNPIYFLRPLWDPENPTEDLYPGGAGTASDLGPLTAGSTVRYFDASVTNTSPDLYDQHHGILSDGATSYTAQDTRVDVAGIDSAAYRERLEAVQLTASDGTENGEPNGPLNFVTGANAFASPQTWYNRLFARGSKDPINQARFWINPFVLRPLDAGEVSQSTSYLLGGASQFIVEYAGDFLAQTATGAIDAGAPNAGLAPDGEIDFTIDAFGVRHIRWYGLPRNVDGTVAAGGAQFVLPGPAARSTAVTIAGGGASNALLTSTDVRPLADYLPLAGAGAGTLSATNGFPFEKRLPAAYSGANGVEGPPASRDGIADYASGGFTDWSYLVAWGPGDFDGTLYPTTTHNYPGLAGQSLRPSLIRVIVESIDQGGRLEESIPLELVFRVPAQ